MDATSGDAFGLPIEAISNGGIGVDVQGLEGCDIIPISQGDCRAGFGVVGDGDGVANLPFGHGADVAFANMGALRMKTCGEKEKCFVGEGKPVATFVDASFAEEDGLAPGCECVTDDLPFFETDVRHGKWKGRSVLGKVA